MKNGTFRLKGRELYNKFAGEKTLYRVHKDGEVSYPTIHRWINDDDPVDSVKTDILFGFLHGLGLTIDDIQSMTVADLFEYIPEEG